MPHEQKTVWHLFQRRRSQSPGHATACCASFHQFQRILRPRVFFWVSAVFVTIGIGVYLRAEIHRRVLRFSTEIPEIKSLQGGTLLIAGGGKLSEMIRHQFVELAGGRKARIVVIPAMAVSRADLPEYREPWINYGVCSVDVLHADSRTMADDPEFSSILDSATGVWLSGGQQTWLSAWYGRTRVEARLKELLARNGVIGGTSAGAAVMSGVMIAGGRQKPTLARGFDLVPGLLIDQHFLKRNRFQRLQNALEIHPELIGFGIDERTALLYAIESGQFRVIGESCVIACVPRVQSESRMSFHLEILNHGDEFDLERLRRGDPLPPSSIDVDSILLGE